jgi:sigma-B regulation protein RsbU (phosphoserine phosphatase)
VTLVRHALRSPDGAVTLDFTPLLALIVTVLVGQVWGRTAAVATAGLNVVFILAYPLGMNPPRRAIGIPLFLAVSAWFLYLIERERASRARAEAQAAALARERDHLEHLRRQTAAQQRAADEASAEQRTVLLTLQRATLVGTDPGIPGARFALAYAPATAAGLVGGDFYNVFRLSPTRAAVVLGDVTGKGARAAAAGVVLSSMLRAFFAESQSPGDVVRRLNAAVADDPEFPLLATLFAAVVDGPERSVVYANAAQEPPCVIGPWGNIALLESTGPAVGTFADTVYEERRIVVAPDYTLVAFTDGLTEIKLPDDTWMNPQRTYAKLAEMGGSPPGEIVRTLIEWARETSNEGRLRDDAALLAIAFS